MMLITFLQKQSGVIDTILANQTELTARLDRADGEVEQMKIRLNLRQREGRDDNHTEKRPSATS